MAGPRVLSPTSGLHWSAVAGGTTQGSWARWHGAEVFLDLGEKGLRTDGAIKYLFSWRSMKKRNIDHKRPLCPFGRRAQLHRQDRRSVPWENLPGVHPAAGKRCALPPRGCQICSLSVAPFLFRLIKTTGLWRHLLELSQRDSERVLRRLFSPPRPQNITLFRKDREEAISPSSDQSQERETKSPESFSPDVRRFLRPVHHGCPALGRWLGRSGSSSAIPALRLCLQKPTLRDGPWFVATRTYQNPQVATQLLSASGQRLPLKKLCLSWGRREPRGTRCCPWPTC